MERQADLGQSFHILFYGTFIPLQGVPSIVRAAKLLEDDPEIHFTIIGAGQTSGEVEKVRGELNPTNCSFLGRVPFTQIPDYLADADCCLGIFGKTNKTQRVIPNKVYEGVAMAKPVITADTPAIRDVFTDRKDILLCNTDDPKDLAAKIRELKKNPELRATISKGGYETYQRVATPDRIGAALMRSIDPSRNRTVVYTAIFGGKDVLHEPAYVPDGCDFVCFTDTPMESSVWDVRVVEPTSDDPVRSAKVYKVLPHRFLSEYEQSLWIDGNFLLRGNIVTLLRHGLRKHNIAFFDHAKNRLDPRNCVYDEAAALIDMAARGKYKDDPDLVRTQVEHYRSKGYPAQNGLVTAMVIARRHNEPDVVAAMEAWWEEITQWSRRDQLSFNYVAWTQDLAFSYLRGDSRKNRYLLAQPHTIRKSYGAPTNR